MQNFLTILDLTPQKLLHLIERAEFFRKQKNSAIAHDQILTGKNIAMFFEKPSLRTKVSFEGAVSALGGNAIMIDGREVAGSRESIADIARVLDGLVEGVFARVFSHSILTELEDNMDIPVMNALCDDYHPFQALAELQTMKWHFDEKKENFLDKRVVFIGDGCNVPTSLAQGCALLGISFTMCSPKGYEIPEKKWQKIIETGEKNNAKILAEKNPTQAVQNADVIVTDTWVSMGQEKEKQDRVTAFKGFTVDENLMQLANADAIFLHCLPAYRGFEVAEEVIDGKNSWVFKEAECRLHTSKAVLEMLYAPIKEKWDDTIMTEENKKNYI